MQSGENQRGREPWSYDQETGGRFPKPLASAWSTRGKKCRMFAFGLPPAQLQWDYSDATPQAYRFNGTDSSRFAIDLSLSNTFT
jgi:hypothetical protein